MNIRYLLISGTLSLLISLSSPAQEKIKVFKDYGTFKITGGAHSYFGYYGISLQYYIRQEIGVLLNMDRIHSSQHHTDPYTGYHMLGWRFNPEIRYYFSRKNFKYNTSLFIGSGFFHRSTITHSAQWLKVPSLPGHVSQYIRARTRDQEWGNITKIGIEMFPGKRRKFTLELSYGLGFSYIHKNNNGLELQFLNYNARSESKVIRFDEIRIGAGYKIGQIMKRNN